MLENPSAVTAAAPAASATIDQVRSYQGTTQLCTLRGLPYSWSWKNVPPGDYTLTSIVTDSNGNTTRSLPIHVKVTP